MCKTLEKSFSVAFYFFLKILADDTMQIYGNFVGAGLN